MIDKVALYGKDFREYSSVPSLLFHVKFVDTLNTSLGSEAAHVSINTLKGKTFGKRVTLATTVGTCTGSIIIL